MVCLLYDVHANLKQVPSTKIMHFIKYHSGIAEISKRLCSKKVCRKQITKENFYICWRHANESTHIRAKVLNTAVRLETFWQEFGIACKQHKEALVENFTSSSISCFTKKFYKRFRNFCSF